MNETDVRNIIRALTIVIDRDASGMTVKQALNLDIRDTRHLIPTRLRNELLLVVMAENDGVTLGELADELT